VVPQWPGGHVGCFSMAVLAGSPIPMAPFLVWSSYVRRSQPSIVTSAVPMTREVVLLEEGGSFRWARSAELQLPKNAAESVQSEILDAEHVTLERRGRDGDVAAITRGDCPHLGVIAQAPQWVRMA
jgi:hypothetical protein